MADHWAKVLIVDDEWTIRQQLTRALSSVGFDCECAADGCSALEQFAARRHDLVVTDLRMPAGNGHSLAVALLGHTERPKVIVLTGVTEPRIVNDLLARGIDDIVFKPVDYFEMADGLRQLLAPAYSQSYHLTQPTLASQLAQPLGPNKDHESPAVVDLKSMERQFIQSPPSNPWLIAAMRWIDWDRLPKPSDEVYRFIRDLAFGTPNSSLDQRSESRVAFRKVIVAVPLDAHFEPIGRPFKLCARDLSHHSIGFVHTAPFDAPNLCLVWRGSRGDIVVVLARIHRSRQVMNFYDISAEIVDSEHLFEHSDGNTHAPSASPYQDQRIT